MRDALAARGASVARFFPALWVAAFFGLTFTGSVTSPPDVALTVLAMLGAGYGLAFARDEWRAMVADHPLVLAASLALAVAILWSQSMMAWRGVPPSDTVPAQTALLLCLPVLAVFLSHARIFKAVVALFCAVCLWHFVMMPIEAMTGFKLSWHPHFLLAREAWPLRYQASGLAWQTFSFVGLFLPLFYLAWGPVFERRVFGQPRVPSWVAGALPLLWLVPVASVQSRSGLAGALVAGVLAMLAWHKRPGLARWLLLAGVGVLVVWFYLYLFAEGKTGPGLRWAYLQAYVREAMDWQWLATGRGFSREVESPVVVPGLMPLAHSHNDIAQVFYSWGLPGLLAYVAFWFAMLRLVFTRFVARGEYWPALALVAVIPNLVTDVGFHFFEKAAFLVILVAMCMASAPKQQKLA
jgi:hypothetical protein